MKVHIFALFLACLAAISCVAETELEEKTVAATLIELSAESLTMKDGTTATLTATVHPLKAEDRTISWESSDETVATVDQNGQIRALVVGEADITASCSGLSATCKLTVVSSVIPTEQLIMSNKTVSVKVGGTVAVTASAVPENSTQAVTWETADAKTATVDASGKVTGIAAGQTEITATSGDVTVTLPVLVHGELWLEQTDALTKPVSFETFEWDPDTIRVARGETATLQAIVYADAAQGSVTPTVEYFAPQGQKSGLALEPSIYWLPNIKCSSKWDTWAGGPAPDRYPNNQLYLPDPQMPADEYPVNLGEGSKMPLWIEFDIPRDMEAGIYEGLAAVSGSDKGTLPFVVQVYDVTLPQKQTMSVIQWLNYAELNAMATDPGTVEYHTNYKRVENILIPFMARYGTNGFRTFYHKMGDANLHFVKNASGEFEPAGDFSSLKKDIEVMLRACPDLHFVQGNNVIAGVANKTTTGELAIAGYKLNEDGSIKLTDNGNGKYSPEIVWVDQGAEHSAEGEAYLSNYFKALQAFLRSQTLPDGRTWLDIYLQTVCDEPVDVTVPAYERIASYIRKGGPDIKIMEPLTTGKISHEYIDYPCPVTSMLDDNPTNIFCDGPFEYGPDQVRWSYTCMQPQGNGLNRFIRIPLFKTRYIHWLGFLYDNTGYLHWGPNYWVGSPDGDPWKDASGNYIGGDMFIMWPGPETVYPSIRLSAMRDGLRDYDLLKLVAAQSETDAKNFCKKIVWKSDEYETDMDVFRQVRKEILEYLSK